MTLTTVSRKPAGAVAITRTSLILGDGIPRVARSVFSWAIARRAGTAAASTCFNRVRRFIVPPCERGYHMGDSALKLLQPDRNPVRLKEQKLCRERLGQRFPLMRSPTR